MNKVIVNDTSLVSVADSIRTLTGESSELSLAEMPTELDGLDAVIIKTRNGSYQPVEIDATHRKTLGISAYEFGAAAATTNAYSALKKIKLNDNVSVFGTWAFANDTALVDINMPSALTTISVRSFISCTGLTSLVFPNKLKIISPNAFQNCTGLTAVKFTAKPTTLYNSAFNGCSSLTSIKVPWSEGEVDDAPWGAVNATISYNYTGD